MKTLHLWNRRTLWLALCGLSAGVSCSPAGENAGEGAGETESTAVAAQAFQWSDVTHGISLNVRVCRDRAMSSDCGTVTRTIASVLRQSGLGSAQCFARVTGVARGVSVSIAGLPLRPFAFPCPGFRSAPDFNGDGFVDLAVGSQEANQVYLYYGSARGLAATPSATLSGPDAGAYFGAAVAVADVNGDGFSDAVVGGFRYQDERGRAYVYYGSEAGLATTAATVIENPQPVDAPSYAFGIAVANAGDVNGDGSDDVVIGAPATFDAAGSLAGAAYLYYGAEAGLTTTPSVALPPPGTGHQWFGYSVAGAGDVNGDGYGDFIVGASHNFEVTSEQRGRAYIFHGGRAGAAATPTLTLEGPDVADNGFGWSVAGAGDVNGDGYSDVIVGAYGIDENDGRGYVYHGGARGLSATPVTTLAPAPGEHTYFAYALSSAGDVNHDGYADVVVGETDAVDYRGRISVYLGGARGVSATAASSVVGPSTDAGFFGQGVAGIGDVDGDGRDDIVAAATGVNGGAGEAYLFRGARLNGIESTPSLTFVAPVAGGHFGFAVAGAAP